MAKPNANYDLTTKMMPFIDNHFLIQMLDFLKGTDLYSNQSLVRAQINAMETTHLAEPALELIKQLPGKPDPALESKFKENEATAASLRASYEEKCAPLLEIIGNETELDTLVAEERFSAEVLETEYSINANHVEAFLQYARIMYQSGAYDNSSYSLYYYRAISPNPDKLIACHWGKIAAQIMTMETNETIMSCWADFEVLQKLLDEKDEKAHATGTGAQHLEVLQMRAWLIHWSLFLFFKQPITDEPAESRNPEIQVVDAAEMPRFLLDTMIQFFLQERHFNAIQVYTPWVLRYLAAAVVLRKPNKYNMRDVVRTLNQESYVYKDPVTQFLVELLVEFDFKKARLHLDECAEVFATDFFLHHDCFGAEFMKKGRLLMFETYCRVHTKIEINWLSEQLGLNKEDAEGWVVKLIRDAKLDARIDSENGCVIMGHKSANPYQTTIDKTKDLTFRTYQLVSGVSNN